MWLWLSGWLVVNKEKKNTKDRWSLGHPSDALGELLPEVTVEAAVWLLNVKTKERIPKQHQSKWKLH